MCNIRGLEALFFNNSKLAELRRNAVVSVSRVHWRWVKLCTLLCLLCSGLVLSACAPAEVAWDDQERPRVQPIKPAPSIPPRRRSRPPAPAVDPATLTSIDVWLYVSPASQAQLMAWGADPTTGLRIWENYLRANNIAFARITGAKDLNRVPASGILLLASTVVLSEPEKQAVLQWRNRGGSVLSTWLTATQSETGESQGDAFMREVLDVRVAGNTQDEVDDTFMIVHGDNPVTHTLPAGSRVWLERVPKQLPLRLIGKHESAQIMSWSRNYDSEKPSGLLTFNERQMPSGQYSRTVTLGYPEQNWLRSDPKQLNAVASGILSWLWRRPDAYLGAWPHPYQSGLLFAMQAGETLAGMDVAIGKTISDMGGRATFYVHGGNAAKAAAAIKSVKAQGHDIGYFSDRFEGFQGQPESIQSGRLDTMHKQFAEARIAVSTPSSFSAPMDSYDKTTQRLLVERQFDNYLAFMEVTDSSLPLVVNRNATGQAQTVALPRTMIGPEETTDGDDPDAELASYLKLIDVSVDMGGLMVISIPSQTLLTAEQRKRIFDKVATLRSRIWMASANQIARWWRSREQVSVALEPHPQGHLLRATVAGSPTATQPLTIWVNLPHPDSRVRLQALQKGTPVPRVIAVDSWRSAIVLDTPGVGKQEWLLQFEGVSTNAPR